MNVCHSNLNSLVTQIDLSNFTTGIYFIKLNTEEGIIVRKIVIR